MSEREPSGWFDFKGADAAWDEWLAKRGFKDPLKPITDALYEADRKLYEALDKADRDWGLKSKEDEMSAFEVGTEFEYVARSKGGQLYACVWIDHNGVHVNNPPLDSGIVSGQNMTEAEFVRKATAYIEKMK